MKPRWVRVLVLGTFLLCSFAAAAQDMTVVNDAPAATLLLPYFEVGLSGGPTTVFSINNASATAVLAHIVIWSDLGIPVLTFNAYLTGYDVQVIDLRALIVNGSLPRTASDGQDPADTGNPNDGISNQGNFSQDINFASCNGLLPPPATLDVATLTHLQRSLTGQSSATFGGECAGVNRGDNIARGFVTIDAVNNCTLRWPGMPGYFGPGGTGDVTNQNVFWGDYYYINQGTNQANGHPMVHVRASATDPETSVAGEYTFYGRAVGWTAADNRQPLATSFATRFMLNTLYFPDGTDLVVWRDPKVSDLDSFPCASLPSWYPLNQEAIVMFDEQEAVQVNPGVLTPFPAAAQRVKVGSASLPAAPNRGWMYLNLNSAVVPAGANPPEDPAAMQGFVTLGFNRLGFYSAGARAIQLESAANTTHVTPGL